MSISFKDILFKRIIFQLIFVAIVFSANAQRFNYLKLGVKDGLPNSDITCLHKDATGNIWVGTREGIRKYNGQKFKSISQINGDKNVKTIKSICETNSYIWFASERTLSRVEGDFAQEFKFHTRNNPFLINKIIPVNDSVLFILSNSGVWTFKNNEFKQIFTTLKIDFENIICGAFIQSKNELWLGTEADGLFILDLKKKVTIIIVTHNMQQAARISDKTAFFLMGDLVEFGDTSQIFTVPKQEQTERYITRKFG